MATVTLKGIKKIYPLSDDDKKKGKKGLFKKHEEEIEHEEKVNLQITDQGTVAVQEFNLDIADKEFIVLVGPSGCGKSTTLRMIAGLETISEGELYIDGQLVNNKPPKDRDIAMVFQNYALYPHMSVYDNLAFALKIRKTPKDIIDKKVRDAAEILGITEYLHRKPKALSGGQRQRVAIGRAIVREPQVFLMDEPLSNLDAKLRNQMRAEIIKLRQRIDTTFIYVTHDQTEAMTLGDRIVIMKDGFIQQIGTPYEVFHHPANLFVAGFIGTPQMNFFKTELAEENGQYYVPLFGVKFPMDAAHMEQIKEKGIKPQEITMGIRPEDVSICYEGGVEATVDVCEMMGSSLHIHTTIEDKEIVVIAQSKELPEDKQLGFAHGDKIRLHFDGHVLHLFGLDEKNLF